LTFVVGDDDYDYGDCSDENVAGGSIELVGTMKVVRIVKAVANVVLIISTIKLTVCSVVMVMVRV